MGLTTNQKRLLLRTLTWAADDKGGTLLDELKAFAKAQVKEVSSGKVIYQASANGHYYAWDIPNFGTPWDVVDVIEQLLTRYEEAVEYLEDESATNTAIFNEMMRHLKAVRAHRNDYTYGRIDLCEVDD